MVLHMWTVCWKDDEQRDRWDRFEIREDVVNLVNTLVREVDVSEDDILIFPPEADELTIPYDEIENE
jgi:hypothetical protein